MSSSSCEGENCEYHYHGDTLVGQQSQAQLVQRRTAESKVHEPDSTVDHEKSSNSADNQHRADIQYDPEDHGFRRIIRNFTPSCVVLVKAGSAVS